MSQNVWRFALAMYCGQILETINYFLKHGHNEHSNPGRGALFGGGEGDEVSRHNWSAIHKKANVQTQRITSLFAHFGFSWTAHGCPRERGGSHRPPRATHPHPPLQPPPTRIPRKSVAALKVEEVVEIGVEEAVEERGGAGGCPAERGCSSGTSGPTCASSLEPWGPTEGRGLRWQGR